MNLTPDELDRYARHIVLREIGGPGQQKLKAARVLVIGAGGLGSPALMYLAAAGVGTLGVIDDDVVSLSNLQRQVLHDTGAVGTPKTDSARTAIARINPHVTVQPFQRRFDEGATDILSQFDLVLDGTDTYQNRRIVNQACVTAETPLIAAAMSQWEGQISLYHPKTGAPCYACIFPDEPASGLAPSCAEAGIMGALAGVMGSMMAGEAVKWITGAGQDLRGKMLIYDALWSENQILKIKADPDCPVCGH